MSTKTRLTEEQVVDLLRRHGFAGTVANEAATEIVEVCGGAPIVLGSGRVGNSRRGTHNMAGPKGGVMTRGGGSLSVDESYTPTQEQVIQDAEKISELVGEWHNVVYEWEQAFFDHTLAHPELEADMRKANALTETRKQNPELHQRKEELEAQIAQIRSRNQVLRAACAFQDGGSTGQSVGQQFR